MFFFQTPNLQLGTGHSQFPPINRGKKTEKTQCASERKEGEETEALERFHLDASSCLSVYLHIHFSKRQGVFLCVLIVSAYNLSDFIRKARENVHPCLFLSLRQHLNVFMQMSNKLFSASLESQDGTKYSANIIFFMSFFCFVQPLSSFKHTGSPHEPPY